ncbi:hypothetical protein CR203_21600 [Salipaludibacillus neizhouensis]|uniref:Uncharacterized protein n=1 Tax=Salipaludibacillus neizhouensis TaxID=885475 RepID=A0A3A9JYJ9_9BACI|nr:HTH domain-containing protein [Salipaludibacillus neizhouensis]RKL65269.1 hypothetical protein CR203_21600 [Salipaludibacillus neizhouensis]
MSEKIFTEKEIELLSKNPYVKSVASKGIAYSVEFKRLFIAEDAKGKLPRQTFEENGFEIDIIGKERLKSAAKRWRKTYIENGFKWV